MSFFVVASWNFLSIWSISQKSALRCSVCSEAESPPEPPQAESETTSSQYASDQEPSHRPNLLSAPVALT